MPQFAPSSVHQATITFSNPKSAGFDYTASLCMGADWTVMATASFHLNAGESKPIAFSVTILAVSGTYPVYISVSSGGKVVALYKATEDVIIAPVGLVLHFSGSQIGAMVWDAYIYDIGSGTWRSGVPSGIKEVATPPKYGGQPNICTFDLTEKTFLLIVQEITYGMTLTKNFGPYLVTIPQFGEYTWNSAAGTIDGVAAVNLPKTNNRSLVTGTLTLYWGIYNTWAGSIQLEKAEDIPGYENVAKYFVGSTIYCDLVTGVPTIAGNPAIPIPVRVSAIVTLRRRADDIKEEWVALEIHEALEYPPEYYIFSGSLRRGSIYRDPQTGHETQELYYQVSGRISQFAVLIGTYSPYGPVAFYSVSPGSGVVIINPAASARMYAHPDPNKVFSEYAWSFYNWQQVASG